MERSGAPLSGGQKQRIALARAFFADPALVVLGAKFNLDSTGEQALTGTLLRAKAKRVTVIVITQRPAVLNAMDKLLILRNGRMEAFGPAAEILVRLVRPANARKLAPSCEGLVAPDQPREVEGAANSRKQRNDTGLSAIHAWHRDVQHSARGDCDRRTDTADLGLWICRMGCNGSVGQRCRCVGSFVATGQNKQVQHLEGGIIRELLVKEGGIVEAGQPLVRLDDTAAQSSFVAW
jgi:ABC-type glutathione transport system ATPase component